MHVGPNEYKYLFPTVQFKPNNDIYKTRSNEMKSKQTFNLFQNRFAAFGAGDTTSLRIYRQDYSTAQKDADDALNVDEDDASPTVAFNFNFYL